MLFFLKLKYHGRWIIVILRFSTNKIIKIEDQNVVKNTIKTAFHFIQVFVRNEVNYRIFLHILAKKPQLIFTRLVSI